MKILKSSFREYSYIYYVGGYAYFGRILGGAVLVSGFLIIIFSKYQSSLFNIADNLIWLGIFALIIDNFCERRAKKELKAYLNRENSGEGNSLILRAVRKLKRFSVEYKWLFDGSFDGRDFRHGNLTRVNLQKELDLRVRIRYADFFFAAFDHADLFNVDFSGSSFRNVTFHNTDMSWIKFRNCKFNGASFEGAKLANTDFTGSNVTIRQLFRAKEIQNLKLPDGRLITSRGDLYLSTRL